MTLKGLKSSFFGPKVTVPTDFFWRVLSLYNQYHSPDIRSKLWIGLTLVFGETCKDLGSKLVWIDSKEENDQIVGKINAPLDWIGGFEGRKNLLT